MPGKERFNIVVAGVGGQGLLTLGRIMGNAAIEAGEEITIAETHGLSQRGGSLIVQIRIGPGESPMIPRGAAHLIIGLEALETARQIVYANKETVIVMNNFIWPPPLKDYPDIDQIISKIKERELKLYIVDANKIAEEVTGSIVAANMAILGYAYAVDPRLEERISKDAVEKAIIKTFRGKIAEANLAAFRKGYEIGKKET